MNCISATYEAGETIIYSAHIGPNHIHVLRRLDPGLDLRSRRSCPRLCSCMIGLLLHHQRHPYLMFVGVCKVNQAVGILLPWNCEDDMDKLKLHGFQWRVAQADVTGIAGPKPHHTKTRKIILFLLQEGLPRWSF